MRNTILIALVCFVFFGCKKETYSSTPSLTYKSVNTSVLVPGNVIKFKIAFTDLEGDLDSIFIQKINPSCPQSGTSEKFFLGNDIVKLKSTNDDLLVSYGYRVDGYPLIGEPKCDFNDTCYFRFSVVDKARHYSDTVQSGKIVIIKQ
ncbi:MAG: hypothetical protein JWR61_5066 [Ferruginibacter sp.]|uniref:hypothetical protein n=1 Tax=Ferruginibacter sp. TaxID=1940288 RepID=UPI0026580E86|nr:hypothetical protein [Ferruginibacter sp.]MDB5280111.1 hypothetical protein [Ferruginibacter sp.]